MLYKNAKVKTYKLTDHNKMLLELLYFKNSPKIKKNNIKPYANGFISITVKNLNKLYIFLKKKKLNLIHSHSYRQMVQF